MQHNLVPATQAATTLGFSRQWLHMLVQKGRLEGVQIGRHLYIDADTLDAYLKTRQGENNAEAQEA